MTHRRQTVLATAALAIVCAVVGLTKVHYALVEDQTLFLAGAETVRNGGTLYRDFWDIKPPGIFLLYYAGCSLFGFSDFGMRFLEVLILSGFAAVAFLLLQSQIGRRAAWLGAFLTVLFYYAISDESDLGNVEGLACLPLAIAAFGLLAPRTKMRLVLAGLSVGLVVLLKPFYGLAGAAFWLVFLLFERNLSRRASTWAILLASAAVPSVATALWFLSRGALPDLINATFTVPYESAHLAQPLKRLGFLWIGLGSFLTGTRCLQILLIPAAWAVYVKVRDRKTMAVIAYLAAWVAAGTAAILLQVRSWWHFHWLLILPPLALLAGFGLDWALTQAVRAIAPRRAIAAVLLAAALWTSKGAIRPLVAAVRSGHWAVPPTAYAARYRRQLLEDARQVACTPSDTALIWLSPLMARFTGCLPASPVIGTNMDVLPPSVLARVRGDLRRSNPLYIYLRAAHIQRFSDTMPGVLDRYVLQYRGEFGSWYRRVSESLYWPGGAGSSPTRRRWARAISQITGETFCTPV